MLHKQCEYVLAALTDANRLVMSVALATGLRLGDVLRLETAKLGRAFTIVEQKTKKKRRVTLPPKLLSELREHAGEKWVFENRLSPDRHRTRQAVWKDVKRAARAFRLPANAAPHSFRKTYAVELLRRYGDIERVQKALNHSDPAVTMIYAMADKLMPRG